MDGHEAPERVLISSMGPESRTLQLLAGVTVAGIVKLALLVALVFVLIEPVVLNRLTGIPPLYLLVSQTMDMAIFGSAMLLLYSQVMLGRAIRALELLAVLALLGLGVAVSIYLNSASIPPAVANFKAIARFLLLSWLIVSLDWSGMSNRLGQSQWAQALLAIALVQLVLALLQRFVGGVFIDAFSFELFSYGGIERTQPTLNLGAAVGTLGRPIGLALYAIVMGVLAVAFMLRGYGRKLTWVLLLAVCLLLVLLSMKRSAILLFAAIPLIGYGLLGRSRAVFNLVGIVVLGCVLMVLVVISQLELSEGERVRGKDVKLTPIKSMQQLTIKEYWQHSLRVSRGWILTTVGPAAVRETPPLGYSMDPETGQQALAEAAQLSRLEGYGPFQDVYWVSLWTFVGPVGMALFFVWFIMLAVRIHRNQAGRRYGPLAGAALILMVLVVPLLFVERVIEVKSFSLFAFTIFGLAASRSFSETGESGSGDQIEG